MSLFQTMKDEFDEKVSHLSTPLFPFNKVKADDLAKWMRSEWVWKRQLLSEFSSLSCNEQLVSQGIMAKRVITPTGDFLPCHLKGMLVTHWSSFKQESADKQTNRHIYGNQCYQIYYLSALLKLCGRYWSSKYRAVVLSLSVIRET